jgi:hypothetical protein
MLRDFRLIQVFQPFGIFFQNARGLAENGTLYLRPSDQEANNRDREIAAAPPPGLSDPELRMRDPTITKTIKKT